MANKNGQITNSVFKSEWKAPNGMVMYYHELTFDNGDKGTCGLMEQSPPRIWNGARVVYTIDDKKKIKIVSSDMDDESTSKQQEKGGKQNKNGVAKQDSFLGYAWSYSKDLIIAGKTMEDVEELNKIARYIYDEIGKMLQNE
jgi:hypothetical protein